MDESQEMNEGQEMKVNGQDQDQEQELPEADEGNSEVDDMFDGFFDKPSEEKPVEQEEVPQEESSVEEEPAGEKPAEEEPAEEPAEELVEEPVEDLDELSGLKEQNKALLEHLEKLSQQVVARGFESPPKELTDEVREAAEQPAQPAQPVPQRQQFTLTDPFDGVSMDEILEEPEKLKSVLEKVQENAIQMATERVLRSVPEMVIGYTTRQTAMSRMVDDFYREHPDLSNVKQTVAAIANTVHSEHTDWGVDQVFQETAQRTRKLLGLRKQATQQKAEKPKKPAFAKQRGARKEEPALGGLQKEINDLLIDI